MLRKLPFLAATLLAAMLVAPATPAQNHSSLSRTQTPSGSTLIPIPYDLAADSYAIYSLLMPGAPFDKMSPEQTRRWAISDATVNITDMDPAVPPDGQLKAPPENVKAFHEALQDFEARKYQRFRLESDSFHIDHPYSLLDAAQVNDFRQARGAVHPTSQQRLQYEGYPGVTFFSAVYFNSAQTAALVYMNNWCANLCASGQWVYLEKQNGHWIRRSGILAKGA